MSGSSNSVGGLVGYNNSGTITNSYSTGTVSGGGDFVGGLAGYNGGTITNSYSTGAVSGSDFVGGLAGYNDLGTITGSYWDTQTSGTSTGIGGGTIAGATGLTTAQMMQSANFTGWDFTTIWRIYEGYTYPLLKSFLTPLTVTANADSKTYDGLTYSGGNGVTYSIASPTLSGTLAYSGTSQGATNTGSYVITPGGYYSNQQGYDITFANGALTVNPAALTVTANADSKTYDGLAYTGGNGVTYTGLVNGETSAVLGGTLAYSGTSQGATNAGSYIITPGGQTSGNYTITFANGALTVNPAALTITADNKSKTYGDANPAFTATYSGLKGSDTSSVVSGLNISTAAATNSNVGSYTITAADGTAGNYTITFANGSLSITPAALTVTAQPNTKTYDGNTSVVTAPTITSGTLFGTDTANFSETYDNQNAGTAKTLTASGTVNDGNSGNNYTYTFITDTTGVITPAALTITADNKSKTYGDANPALTATYSGLKGSDTSSVVSGLNISTAAATNSNVGSYTITAADGTATNYTITFANGALTITAAPSTASTSTQTTTSSVSTILDMYYIIDTENITDIKNFNDTVVSAGTPHAELFTAKAVNYEIEQTVFGYQPPKEDTFSVEDEGKKDKTKSK